MDVYPIYADRERLVKEEFPLWSQRIFDYLKVREVRKEEITGYYIVYSETPEILKFLKKASSSWQDFKDLLELDS